ncbi:ABC transporter substrate-binding protein [Vibrio sp. JC009]|uniref:ABC transporter substrate-binding protein n=1 Tax=Vibrio sp. JC009 TaxID=2912314 RepID=UPI0023AF323F|nr:ABC transporter substrate-binding protein [Vibrio sp. JC009]WED23636.1 ABC transporter substrate-binding protein [Vibrio sp. JC009]
MKMNKVLLALTTVSASTAFQANADTVKLDCEYTGTNAEYCQYIKDRFEAETEHTLKFVELPPASDEKLGIFQQSFAAKSSDVVDLFRIDTVWPGVLGQHLLDLTEHYADRKDEFFVGVWENNTVNGKLLAVPSNVDSGMLYYRKDLLEKYGKPVPKTWAEMKETATEIMAKERVAGNKNFWGYVFQGKAYEGLSCDGIEWVSSFGGGTIVDADGNITVNNEKAAAALDMAASFVGSISPKGALGYMEEESRAVFQNGDSLFMRNWPYAYILGNGDESPVKGKIGIAPLPSSDASTSGAAALGGWQYAINKYTKSPEAAMQLLDIILSPESQKKQFMVGGQSSGMLAMYDDPEVLAKAPHMKDLKDIFVGAVARPSTPTKRQYPKVSKAFFNASYDVLSGKTDGTKAVVDLEKRLKRIKGKGWK